MPARHVSRPGVHPSAAIALADASSVEVRTQAALVCDIDQLGDLRPACRRCRDRSARSSDSTDGCEWWGSPQRVVSSGVPQLVGTDPEVVAADAAHHCAAAEHRRCAALALQDVRGLVAQHRAPRRAQRCQRERSWQRCR